MKTSSYFIEYTKDKALLLNSNPSPRGALLLLRRRKHHSISTISHAVLFSSSLSETVELVEMAATPASIFDSLFCSEYNWAEDGVHKEEEDEGYLGSWGWDSHGGVVVNSGQDDRDLSWDEDELEVLLSKEENRVSLFRSVRSDGGLARARAEAVEWMMKAHSYYDFSALTAVLAVNYLDRFLSEFHRHSGDDGGDVEKQRQQPWMTQLTGVACLSLAAKVEETKVPLLLDLQVEESRYLFEAKTVRKMELLVLSTLQWRMNQVTPLSFVDYCARRLGLKGHLCLEFVRMSELVLLNIIPDPRFLLFRPSAMAAAVMLHAIDSFDPRTKAQYQDQLLGILPGIGMDVLDECCNLVSELATKAWTLGHCYTNKRKFGAMTAGHSPGSPSGVVDACFSCSSDSDSWSVLTAGSVSSSPEAPLKKSCSGNVYCPIPNMNNED